MIDSSHRIPALIIALIDGFDRTTVSQINMEITADSLGPWTNPTTVYIDSIRTSNGVVNHTFDTSINNMVGSSKMVVAGSTYTWSQSLP